MTCETRAQVKGTSENQKGTGHKMGTGLNFSLCPHKLLFSFYFLTKGHKGTKEEGGIREMGKTIKTGQKGAKREKYTEHQQNWKNLCLVPFSKTGAMA